MLRLFVALRPPPPVRSLLLDTMSGVRDARWQDDSQLHVTLRFIGEVDEHVAADVDAALSSVYAPPVPMRIDGVGQFEDRGHATALWAAVAPREPIAALHARIDAALIRAGLLPERRTYHPHVTLARLNWSSGPVEDWIADHAALKSDTWTANAFEVYSSELGRSGAHYEAIARYPLRG
ncbi:RNA 2',3'-cyclic phosphodiesterase [Sphingomonas sp. RS2018]